MNYLRSFFTSTQLPCTIDTIIPSITPTPTTTQFEYTGTISKHLSHTHLFVLNPSHYQFSSLFSTPSTALNISRESSATQFRLIHNFRDLTLRFVGLYSKKDGPFAQTELSLLRPSFHISLKQILPTFDNKQIFALNILKSINKRLCLGIETVCDNTGVGGSLYGRLDVGTVLYGKIGYEELKIGAIRKMGLFTLASECRMGDGIKTLFGIKLETRKANVHVGIENAKGKMELEQRVGQGMLMRIGSEIDLKSGVQSAGISFSIDN